MREVFLLVITLISFFGVFTAKGVPFTQEDRGRIIRLEVKVEALQNQIDVLGTLILWDFGVLFSGMGILIGLVMWDRRSAISPKVAEALKGASLP
ncbi:MAG: hypothetical protein ACK4VK_03625 [Aquificaceae bacterium]